MLPRTARNVHSFCVSLPLFFPGFEKPSAIQQRAIVPMSQVSNEGCIRAGWEAKRQRKARGETLKGRKEECVAG